MKARSLSPKRTSLRPFENWRFQFERDKARGCRLNIPAGTAVRVEPGQTREVELVEYAGARVVYGFNARVMGALEKR